MNEFHTVLPSNDLNILLFLSMTLQKSLFFDRYVFDFGFLPFSGLWLLQTNTIFLGLSFTQQNFKGLREPCMCKVTISERVGELGLMNL